MNFCSSARLSRYKEIAPGMKEDSFIVETHAVGEIVMRRLQPFEKVDKLDCNWSGPFRIFKCYRRGGLKIENLNGKIFKVNMRDVKRMKGSDSYEWETVKEGGMLVEEQECLVLNTFNC
ncbi:hypothetical protein ENBRE01_2295 [Enteropsectra breve]|nr:hypothetical protein ENBRE01_2295 [Enteropsectra breve]